LEHEIKPSSSSENSRWLRALPYIATGVYGFFVWLVSRSDPPHEHPTDTIPPQDNTPRATEGCKHPPARPVRVVIESFPPAPTPPDKWRAEKNKKNRREWLKLGVEVLTLFVITAYTFVSCNQWKTAEKQLEVSERPWIVADVALERVTFSDDGSAQVFVHYALKNIGHSPAMAVRIRNKLVLAPHQDNGLAVLDTLTPAIKTQNELCAVPQERNNGSRFEALFPGQEEFETTWVLDISKEEIAGASYNQGAAKGDRFILPAVVGCIDYFYSFTSSAKNPQTGFIYQIAASGGGFRGALRIGKNVPSSDLVLFPMQQYAY
jgi:hypothetical protein